MSSPLKIGFIGLDTSHVSAFARLLNDPQQPHHVPGARVTAAWAGGSADFPLSINRVAGFTAELTTDRGVEILSTPEAVAEASDLVFITSVDGRMHLDLLRRTVKYRKPTFIDKPLATSLCDAREIMALAERSGVPVMSSSSLRYSQHLTEALAAGREGICGCSLFGPMAEEPTQPGWFWYGIHCVEMMVVVMGLHCRQVRCHRNANHDLLTAVFDDGRVASIHGVRNAHNRFGLVIQRKDGPTYVDASAGVPHYAGLLRAILEHLPRGRSAIPQQEMLHVIEVIEAANASRARDGLAVSID